ncbi:PREDICTED: uncharacterized protein LOC107354724 isoform X2 [Acropora digitifera]|uniref:uncharacterized protein LOC107354724 isoform X2 n=1 Tax=Acropora digitifera TaxID=70779 RepID=UPI00077AFF8C|nr:PREDICTED: uncharacterized protein LOC107354724 isoform X2 [Acropora digitifera]
MSSSTLLEMFSHIVFSFTRGVAEHYNPDEPEFTPELFGYNALESTGREWNFFPVDEMIYQEYSDRQDTTLDYLAASGFRVRINDACLPNENQGMQERQPLVEADTAMAWKRLRPSALATVCKSLYIGASISILAATTTGVLYSLITYVSYQTLFNCEYRPGESIPVKIQWIRTISTMIAIIFLYMCFLMNMLFLFRPYQLSGVKRKCALVAFLLFSLDALYRLAFQIFQISHSKLSKIQTIPLNAFFLISAFWQLYFIVNHFRALANGRRVHLFLKMIMPSFFSFVLGILITTFIYPWYNNVNDKGKYMIALFSPLTGVVFKAISRICVQRLWNITHPGYSYVLLVPSYFGLAINFRVLQADLESIKSIATIGIIHGSAEVIERSAIVFIDHICNVIWKRSSAPWGHFRTPRRERLMADIVIISMLYEAAAIVCVNGVWFLYQWVYIEGDFPLHLFVEFVLRTSIALVIEWFFSSVSLTIVTRYQNMAAMAVWRKRWKRHILVALANSVPLALWISKYLLQIISRRFDDPKQSCKMPFT